MDPCRQVVSKQLSRACTSNKGTGVGCDSSYLVEEEVPQPVEEGIKEGHHSHDEGSSFCCLCVRDELRAMRKRDQRGVVCLQAQEGKREGGREGEGIREVSRCGWQSWLNELRQCERKEERNKKVRRW